MNSENIGNSNLECLKFNNFIYLSLSWNAGFIGVGVDDHGVAAGSADDSQILFLGFMVSFVDQSFEDEGDKEEEDDGGADDESGDSLSAKRNGLITEYECRSEPVAEVVNASSVSRSVVALGDEVSDVESERGGVEVQRGGKMDLESAEEGGSDCAAKELFLVAIKTCVFTRSQLRGFRATSWPWLRLG